jgi:hypothetical protein
MRARRRQAHWRRILRNDLSVEIVGVFLKPRGGVRFGNGDCRRVSDIVLSSIDGFREL